MLAMDSCARWAGAHASAALGVGTSWKLAAAPPDALTAGFDLTRVGSEVAGHVVTEGGAAIVEVGASAGEVAAELSAGAIEVLAGYFERYLLDPIGSPTCRLGRLHFWWRVW